MPCDQLLDVHPVMMPKLATAGHHGSAYRPADGPKPRHEANLIDLETSGHPSPEDRTGHRAQLFVILSPPDRRQMIAVDHGNALSV
jgi:hypothetical protein